LIGDEVFADYAHEPVGTPPSVLALEDVITCSLGGLSKSVGLPQLKLAWIVFGGPQARVSDLLNVYEVIADAYLSVSTPVQAAAPELLHEGAAIRRQIQQRVAQNLSRLRALLVDYPAVTVLRCEGGWSAVVQLPALRDEEQLILELLTGEHVLVHPGFFFDFDRDTFVIVSLLVEPARFELGVSRMLARATATPVEP
jgi:aspartate/methionine/tyrosine aminotransferase